jgi:hypothetical protein
MRCDQCKHWEAQLPHAAGLALGECNRAQPLWEATDWVPAGVNEDGIIYKRALKPEFEGLRFFAQDGSDYNAFVMTTPDFFCADFTQKTP